MGFDDPSFDESEWAAGEAARVGARHHAARLSIDDALDSLPEIVASMDEPIADSSSVPTWLLARETSKRVKVVLSGDGGDELLYGYDPFAALKPARLYRRTLPDGAHRAIKHLIGKLPVSHANMSLDFKLKRTLRGLDHEEALWAPVWMGPLSPIELQEVFGSSLALNDLYSEAIECWESSSQDNPFDRLGEFFIKLYLQNDILTKSDRAGMAHGLEVRAPFLDIDLVDFIRTVPWQLKYRRGTRKYLLKRALRGVVPDHILSRPKKGFGTPIGRWFKDGHLDAEAAEIAGISSDFLRRRGDEHRAGRSDQRLFLWAHWVAANHAPSKLESTI